MQRPEDQPETDFADVAEESPEASAEAELEVVGEDEPDVGDTVTPDQSQSADDGGAESDDANPFAPRVPDPRL